MNPIRTLRKKILDEFLKSPPELRAFMLGILFLGINNGILNSTFNNFLDDTFHIDAAQRGFLEFPREFPGFTLIFVTGLLSALTMRAWGILVGVCSAIGVIGLGWASPNAHVMIIWMVMWSLADHLFMPIQDAMGLSLAKGGSEGRRLGQISGMRNLAMIGGTLLVTILTGAGFLHYGALYALAGVSALLAALAFWKTRLPESSDKSKKRFVFSWHYRLYYVLNILFGARKQVFLTFGPWVLVSVLGTPAQTMAVLLMIAAIIGVVFRQYFGIITDRYGERVMLAGDSLIFLAICLGFAFSKNIWLLYVLYIVDNLMFATRIARTTYLNRITKDRRDIPATLSMGVTLDHAVSMTIPIVGGVIWAKFGYHWVFLAAAGVAALNMVAALRIPARNGT